MTDTVLANPPDEQTKIHPSEVLMRVIIALLTPAFVTACGGDTTIARLAAFETIKQYNPRGHVELIIAAQIIACGLASAASGITSLRAELSASMALRLRANAAALSRAAERATRALAESPKPDNPALRAPGPVSPEQLDYEDKVLADVAVTRTRTGDAMARLNLAQPKAAPAPIPAPKPVRDPIANQAPAQDFTDAQWEAMWAGAMTGVAEEFTADLENLSPEEREEAIRKAAILSDVANKLLVKRAPAHLRPADANP